ncbi:MAG: DNA-directed RNA polymerase subunit omega [Christensenellales bacterium]|jgi:DNA-directed RNA polymerase subunit omega|nr:DNA-directed RNA polymerase subunit omega [Christensenellaceae bacterium]HHU02097.1 DNA-directed RNA polymerase subunit omega [Christensenellaceae bacterium]
MAINEPNLEELLEKNPSAYTLVVEASKRARELIDGAQPLVEPGKKKPLSIAIEEINRGLITSHRKLSEED